MVKNEKLLQLLQDAKKVMAEGQEVYLQKLETALVENIREEVAKDKGNKNQLKIVKDIIKQNKKDNSLRPALLNCHKFVYNNITYKGFTNNYYIVASQDDFNYTEEKTPIKMTDFFNDIQYCDRDLTIDIADLKLFVKTHKDYKNNPYIVDDGDFKIAFNAKYLLNVISFTGSNILKARGSLLSAFTVSEDNKSIALILPIRINQ